MTPRAEAPRLTVPCSRCKAMTTYRHSTPTHKGLCVRCVAELTKGSSK